MRILYPQFLRPCKPQFYNFRFRFIAILASIVGASAFAPMGRVAHSSALKMDYSGEYGVTVSRNNYE